MRQLVAAVCSLAVVGLAAPLGALTWTIEDVTPIPKTQYAPYVFVDKADQLHIAYTSKEGTAVVYYATNAGGTWQSFRVTDSSATQYCTYGIAIDDSGKVYIALKGGIGADSVIYLASGRPGSWHTERVAAGSGNEGISSVPIAVDHGGFVHLAYIREIPPGTDMEVLYATNRSGNWVEEQVTSDDDDEEGVSLALDGVGNPHLAYGRWGEVQGAIYHAWQSAGVWQQEEAVVGFFPSLWLDARGGAHITCARYCFISFELFYANNLSGTWQDRPVTADTMDKNWASCVLVDDRGGVHIAYHVAPRFSMIHQLYYAESTAGAWVLEPVTSSIFSNEFYWGRAFVRDAQGYGHIVFNSRSAGQGDIFHARSDTPLPTGIDEGRRPEAGDRRARAPSLSIAPNPVRGACFVRYVLPPGRGGTLSVHDAGGRVVQSRALPAQPSRSAHGLRLAFDGPPGVYFVRLTSGARAASAKVVKLE